MSMLPPGGTVMTTRIVRAACDHAGRSVSAMARLSNASAPAATTRAFRMFVP